MAWTSEELKKIRENLPLNGRQILADKFEITYRSIGRILSGTSKNDAVLIAASAMAREHQELIEKSKQSINAL